MVLAVHVVRIDLAPRPEILTAYEAMLPTAERSARPEIVIARAATRDLLSRVLGTSPDALKIERTCARCGDPRHGKPFVPGGEIAFSLTHSGALGLLAWTTEAVAIGVDVEAVRERAHLDRLAERVLEPEALTAWQRSPEPERLARFLRAWTAKEAYLKATGEGIVSKGAARPLPTEGWTNTPLNVRDGFVGALAVDRPEVDVIYDDWDPLLRMAELQAHPRPGARDLRD